MRPNVRHALLVSAVFLGVMPSVRALDVVPLLVGVGRAELAFPEGVPLAGYSKRHGESSEGVDAPLAVRALAFRQGEATAVIVSAEVLIINEALFQAVQRELTERFGAAPEQLLLTPTHTHSGPGAYGRHWIEKISMGAYDPSVFQQLAEQIAIAVGQALDDLRPAEIGYADVAVPGLVRNRRSADGLVDDHLRVVGIRAPDGSLRAVLVNFAAHPTLLGSDNMRLSGDYPGVIMRTLEAQWPESTCLFTISNLGDQGPAVEEKSVLSMVSYGSQLAAAVTQLVTQLEWQAAPVLQVAGQTMPLPPGHLRLGWLNIPRAISNALLRDRSAMLSIVRIGDVALVGYPGEPTAGVGQHLKDRLAARGWQTLLLALTDEYIGYVVTTDEYATKTYEAEMSFFGPDLAQRLEDAVMGLVELMPHAITATP